MSASALWIGLAAVAVPVALGSYRLLGVLDLDVARFCAALLDALSKPDLKQFASLLSRNGRSLPAQLASRAWDLRHAALDRVVSANANVGYRERAPAPDRVLRKLLAPELNRLNRRLLLAWLPTTVGVAAPILVAFARSEERSLWHVLAALVTLGVTLVTTRRARELWRGMNEMLERLLPLLQAPPA